MVRRLKALSTREAREENSIFLVEGTNLLKEAIESSVSPLEVFATADWLRKHPGFLDSISDSTLLIEVTNSVLEAALSLKNPDGVAALLPLDGLPKPRDSVDLVLALDRLQDPGNLGNLFRTALAADVDVLWLALGVDPLNQKVLRASSGAVLKLPYERLGVNEEVALEELANRLSNQADRGYQVVATSVPGTSSAKKVLPYWELDWTIPTVLVLGNEGSGLHPLLKRRCTHEITLPHSSAVESLNVASAAVPMLLERRRAKMTDEIQINR